MSLVAAVSSAKGGSGKSVTALNLALALHSLGRDVTLVDANLSAPSLGLLLGAPRAPVTLHHVLKGEADVHQAVYRHASGMKVVPGSLQHHDLQEKHLATLPHHLHQLSSDLILLDAAPGLGNEAQHALHPAEEVLVVTTPDAASVTQSLKTVKAAQAAGKLVRGVVVTRYGKRHDLALQDIQHMLDVPLLAVIPEDHHVASAAARGDAVLQVFPDAPASVAYMNLALYLTGERDTPAVGPVDRPSEGERPGFGGEENQSRPARFLNWVLGK